MKKLCHLLALLLLLGLLAASAAPALAAGGQARQVATGAIHQTYASVAAHSTVLLAKSQTPPTSCDQDPVTCANTLTKPVTGLYQTGVMVALIILSCIGGLALLIAFIRGIIDMIAGEPRAMGHLIKTGVAIAVVLVIGLKSPAIAAYIVGGQHITPPALPQASGS